MQRALKFCAAVVLTMAATATAHYVRAPELSPIELEEWIGGAFGAKGWNGSWVSDSGFIFKNSAGDVLKYDLRTRTSGPFLSAEVLAKYPGSTITVSDDEAYVLIRYNVSSVFRHSTTALYTIYDMSNGKYYDIANSTPVQLVTFAPAGHGLTYVVDNNIYYLEDFAVDVANPVTVTNVGEVGKVYCGVPDWVYEEEVLGSGSALWFSPKATHLAYAVFHDEHVRNFSYFIYGEPGEPGALYPTEAVIKYPKVGTPNPSVTVFLYDIAAGETLEFQLPSKIDNKDNNDYVLYGLTWATETEVAMISTNRIQNESIVVRCAIDGSCREEVSYKEENGWLDPHIPRYADDGSVRLEILPEPVDGDKYDHLVYTDVGSGDRYRLTDGKRMIKSVYGWDEASGLVYYSASVEGAPHQQHVYALDISTTTSVCLSCDVVVDGDFCTYASATFSKALSYYVLVCSGPNPHYVQLRHAKDPNDFEVWEDNLALRARLALRLRPRVKDVEVIVEGYVVRARLLLPPTLDELSDRKYPAIVNVYAGPNSNQISDTFGVSFQDYIVTKREYIYIFIDGRGSGNDGWNKMFTMYRKFGTVEIEDQITVTRYLQQTLPYIDETRIGIWGWSYGGFASSWALAKDVDHVFNFALAVAPVTNFIYYDTIYTERYMGLPTPEDNEAGYNGTDLTRAVEAFRGRQYFIIHGNADDNVHYQNAMLLVKALEHADIDFKQQSYPDENHSLGGVYPHLYHTIDRYWARCFDLERPPIVSWDLSQVILV